ncbi:hypothetical protein ACWDYK_40255, partial [Streptomyces anthocyanicus]
ARLTLYTQIGRDLEEWFAARLPVYEEIVSGLAAGRVPAQESDTSPVPPRRVGMAYDRLTPGSAEYEHVPAVPSGSFVRPLPAYLDAPRTAGGLSAPAPDAGRERVARVRGIRAASDDVSAGRAAAGVVRPVDARHPAPVVPAVGGDVWMRSWASSRNWTVEFAETEFGRAFALVADVFPYRPGPAGAGVDVGYRERLGSLVASVAVARAGVQSTSKGKEGEHGPSALFDEQLVSALRGVVAALDADAGPVSATGARPESGDGQAVAGTGRTVGDALRELAALVPDTPGQELLELLQAVRAAQDDTDSESVPGESDAMIRTLALEDLPRHLAIWAHTAYSTLRPMPLSVDAAAVDALHQQRADH